MPDSVPMIRMSDVQQTAVHWLWYPYIPFGKLTILQGNPGEGKTYFAMYLTAACTNRQQLPNGELLEPFNVIYQTAEDGLGDTVKPRLIEAGADLDRVLVIDDRESMLTLTDNRIERAIRENQAKLLIIDPIQAFLGAQVDMNRANEVRPIFRALGEIAEVHDCAILMIGHLNKASGSQSTYRGLGSIDMTAAVRSLLFIGKVRDDPTTRVLTHEKSSLAPPGKSLAFSLGDADGFRWLGEYHLTADELLSGSEHTPTKVERAEKLILSLLENGRVCPSSVIDKAAQEQGISPLRNRCCDTLLTARRCLTLSSYRLEALAAALGAEQSTAHRALGDCETTYRVFERLAEDYPAAVQWARPPRPRKTAPSAPRPRVTASQLAHFQSRPKAKDIVPATDLFDPAHPLFDKTCVLTGELLKLSDREAMQRIADCGGKNADNVTKKTDLLIVGGGSPREKKSGKVRKAEEYIEKGIPIQIISEEEFLQM